MLNNRIRLVIATLLLVIFGLILIILGMAMKPSAVEPTVSVDRVQTEAVGAFITELTAIAPSSTPTESISTASRPAVATALSGTPDCLGLRFLRDVTIPDNTEMSPAQVFTKTWLVQNSGTCPWKPGFRVILIGGMAMGGSPFRVAQTVGPGGSIQISIKMAAPTNEVGVVQGTWKMTDENAVQFGDYLSIVIVVSGPTRTASATPTSPVP